MEAFDGVRTSSRAFIRNRDISSVITNPPVPLQLQAWLETEAQLGRVLQALASILDRLPALERAAAGAASGEMAEASSYMRASYVKQLMEAERLAAYLSPLM